MSTPNRPLNGDGRFGTTDGSGPASAHLEYPGSDTASRSAVSDEPAAYRKAADQPPSPVTSDRATITARQRQRFGGIKVGSAFFGWLTATGMAVLLISLLAAAGVAFGVATNTTVTSIRPPRSRRATPAPRKPSGWSARSHCWSSCCSRTTAVVMSQGGWLVSTAHDRAWQCGSGVW